MFLPGLQILDLMSGDKLAEAFFALVVVGHSALAASAAEDVVGVDLHAGHGGRCAAVVVVDRAFVVHHHLERGRQWRRRRRYDLGSDGNPHFASACRCSFACR